MENALVSVVEIGSRVLVRDQFGEDEFVLTAPEDTLTSGSRLSTDSPMGRALLGRQAGERVRFRAPGGIMGVTLVDVR